MSTPKEKEIAVGNIQDAEIIAFLRQHPDFFERYPAVLEKLELPHKTGSAISLIERQVGVLRSKNHQLKKQLNELIQIARENDKLAELHQQLTLKLLKTTSAADAVTVVAQHLQQQFPKEHIVFWLLSLDISLPGKPPKNVSRVDMDDYRIQPLKPLLTKGAAVCGRLTQDQLRALFGENAAIQSAAFMPLTRLTSRGHSPFGAIAIGSADESRFHSSMGTVFLTNMGQLVSCSIERFMGK